MNDVKGQILKLIREIDAYGNKCIALYGVITLFIFAGVLLNVSESLTLLMTIVGMALAGVAVGLWCAMGVIKDMGLSMGLWADKKELKKALKEK